MDLMGALSDAVANPWTYVLLFYIYCVLAAVVLPIPVELGLIGLAAGNFQLFDLPVFQSFLILAVVMGLGKATGGQIVFTLGVKLEDDIRRYLKWGWFQKLMDKSSWLVNKLGYVGLYFVLSIPLMTDTVPLYLFSFLNRDGKIFENKWFFVTNVLAGMSRALIVGILSIAIGDAFVRLMGG
jgi:membrane protein YqaA with SNARE-associated domain